MPALNALSKAWIAAEATLPTQWRLMGVVRGPREVDPAIHSDSWVAWARAPQVSASMAWPAAQACLASLAVLAHRA